VVNDLRKPGLRNCRKQHKVRDAIIGLHEPLGLTRFTAILLAQAQIDFSSRTSHLPPYVVRSSWSPSFDGRATRIAWRVTYPVFSLFFLFCFVFLEVYDEECGARLTSVPIVDVVLPVFNPVLSFLLVAPCLGESLILRSLTSPFPSVQLSAVDGECRHVLYVSALGCRDP
jgi:hypothetical protein